MTQTDAQSLEEIFSREPWSEQEYHELLSCLYKTDRAPEKLRSQLGKFRSDNPKPSGAAALKIGMAQFMLGWFEQALQMLSSATDNKERRYFQGLCFKHMGKWDDAVEELQRAEDRGWDSTEIKKELIEINALKGDFEAAKKLLKEAESKIADTADFYYLQGHVAELEGFYDKAVESYHEARDINPNHSGATFRLAYFYDLHGNEEDAIELYKECVSHPPVNVSALLNLAVLYEDHGENELAAECLRRILSANPNHRRARMFLKDVEASRTMFFDEEQEKLLAKRNAILETPVTDFELSVRARNCLKKMNIRTLGDLVRTTESQLLEYKNFGETSLEEIKNMLTSRGLHLGQALEEPEEFSLKGFEDTKVKNEGVLATPIEQIGFSQRVSKALEMLGVKSLGELADKTAEELLACQNFGQTSLNEVKQRLAEYGLTLRESE